MLVSVTDQAATEGSSVIQLLLERIEGRVPPDRVETVREFARACTRRFSPEELTEVSIDELLGQVLGLFELADSRGEQEVAVRAFNPTVAEDGYQTLGSVLETNV